MTSKGRPSKYKPEYARMAQSACLRGATDQELAEHFDVCLRTIHYWRRDHDEFANALKAGKDLADERVVRSLYQRAVGYEQEEVKIFMPAGATEPVYAKFTAKIAPDVTACIFWLKNRRKDEWRDKHDHELTGKDGALLIPHEIVLKGVRAHVDGSGDT